MKAAKVKNATVNKVTGGAVAQNKEAQEAKFYRQKDNDKAQEREKQLEQDIRLHAQEKNQLLSRIDKLQEDMLQKADEMARLDTNNK